YIGASKPIYIVENINIHMAKKKINFLFVVICIPIVNSCVNSSDLVSENGISISENTQIVQFDPSKDIDTEYGRKASLLIDTLEYFPLADNAKTIVASSDQVKCYDKPIYICNKMKGQIYVYTTERQQLRCIDAKGEAPDEHAAVDNCQLEDDGRLCVLSLSKRKILVYDKFGNFKFSLDADYLASDFHLTGDSIITLYNAKLPNDRFFKNKFPKQDRIVVLNDRSQLVSNALETNYSESILNFPISNNNFYQVGDSLSLMEVVVNVVYRIDNEWELIPRFLFDFKKANLPLRYNMEESEKNKILKQYQSKKDEWATLFEIYETDNYLSFVYGYAGYMNTAFFSKRTGKLINLGAIWINDRDNISMPTLVATGEGDYFYGLIDSYSLRTMVENNQRGVSSRIKKLYADIGDTESPILVSFTLKDF